MLFRPDDETTLKVAFAMTRGVTSHVVRAMEAADVTLNNFFEWSDPQLADALNLNNMHFFERSLRNEALINARKEVEFISNHHIKALFITDEDYPQNLASASEPPVLIYKIGDADLNAGHHVGIVGTRKITPYGAEAERQLITGLAEYFPDLCVWSGLAYGADAIAHTEALSGNRATVAVVAHGLQTIYPSSHRELARKIIKSGGAIISEYPSGTQAYRGHFLERNRIVAWSTDATIVIESEIKGGAMSTANHAFQENRDVFALPGRISDPISAGCNHLIRTNKAHLISSAADFIEVTGWQPAGMAVTPKMRCLFPELSGDNRVIYDSLRASADPMTLDSLHTSTHIPISTLLGLLMELEFDGVVLKLPGNRFSLS